MVVAACRISGLLTMAFGLFMLLVIYFIWVLFSEGLLWKLLLGIFGFIGMKIYLEAYISFSHNTALSFSGFDFSWSTIIPTIIVIMAMANVRGN